MANPTLYRYRTYHYPGGQDHDQESHGNWAEPWSMTQEEFYKHNVFIAPGISTIEQQKKLEALPDDAVIWAYHATDKKTAEQFLREGIDTSKKPMNLARWRLESGSDDPVEFAPGRGLAAGLTVGGIPQDVSGYGRVILAIKTTKKNIETSPEALELGNKSGMAALAISDAQIKGRIRPRDLVLISDSGTYPESGHKELVRAALRMGKKVPRQVLDQYPDLTTTGR